MTQKFNHPSYKVLITGTAGTGKTTLFEKLVRAEKAQWKFVFDHQGEFAGRFRVPSVTNIDDLEDKTFRKGWVVYDPADDFPGKSADGFVFFCEYVFITCKEVRGRKLFCCDELQALTDQHNAPEALLTVCETGRRHQIDGFFISQAPNRIHNSVRNQLTDVYTFRQSDANAIKYLVDNGFNEDEVRNLKQYEAIHRNLRTGQVMYSKGRGFSAENTSRSGPRGQEIPPDESGSGDAVAAR